MYCQIAILLLPITTKSLLPYNSIVPPKNRVDIKSVDKTSDEVLYINKGNINFIYSLLHFNFLSVLKRFQDVMKTSVGLIWT